MPIIATKFSAAIDLLANTAPGGNTLLEVNTDGSIRTQNWKEKLRNWGSHLTGNYQLRKDTKDAAVVVALIALAQRAASGADPIEKNLLDVHSRNMETYGFIARYRDAKQRIDARNAATRPAGNAQIRRDSVASLHAQGAVPTEQTAAVNSAPQAPSVRDTQEFKDRVAALQQEFDPRDKPLFENFIEMRMTEQEGPIAQSLNDAQYFAIKSYSSSAYVEMNAALRDPSSRHAQDPHVVRMNEYATAGLKKLAQDGLNFTGITSRGVVNYDYFINLLENDTYTASAFTSTSQNAATAKNMADVNGPFDNDSTVIHTYGKTGIDIASLSDHRHEAEILYPPGSEFKVIFSGEHITDKQPDDENDPLIKKKVTYLVVEEVATSAKTGVSGIVNALDLASPTTRGVVRQKPVAPVTQAQATGPLVGTPLVDDDDDGVPPIDIDVLDKP
jgi:hypothetical protein